MAVSKPFNQMLLTLLSSLLFLSLPLCSAAGIGNFTSIYQLGDSLSDTGNLIRESPTEATASSFSRLPYGISMFKHPTGRCSNGMLMIDFVAKAMGIPLLNPYLNKDAIFTNGVNFAVAGATALPAESLAAKNIASLVTNSSLGVQLDWMWSYFNSICYDDNDCAIKLEKSLFIVGGIGSNDYYYALSQGKTIGEVNRMVFDVVQAVAEGVRRVVQMGASKVIVPGTFPLGCFPAYLSALRANDKANYDEHSCSTELNNVSLNHNNQLQQAIQDLGQEYRSITIVYGDYYKAFRQLLRNGPRFRFNAASDIQKACCGAGGRYNFDSGRMCGAPGVPVCANPDSYIIWDGINLTQQAYKLLAELLLRSTLQFLA